MKKYPLEIARENSGRTLSYAAMVLGLKVGELSDIEHQRKLPSLELLEAMGELYGHIDLVRNNRHKDDMKLTCPHCGKDIDTE